MAQKTEVFGAENGKSWKPSLPENTAFSYCQNKNSLQIQNFFNKAKNLLIYIFCTSCKLEIVRTVLQIKTKTISCLQFVQNTEINKYFGLIEETMDLYGIFLAM